MKLTMEDLLAAPGFVALVIEDMKITVARTERFKRWFPNTQSELPIAVGGPMKFVRSTHVNGVYRKELGDGATPNAYGFVMHMLDPVNAMTIDEVVRECQKYNRDNYEPVITEAEVALELIRCVEATCARVVASQREVDRLSDLAHTERAALAMKEFYGADKPVSDDLARVMRTCLFATLKGDK